MAVHQHRRHRHRIPVPEGLQNDGPRLLLVLPADLRRRHFAGAGNLPVEVVGMRRPQRRNPASGLSKHGRPSGMGVDNAAHLRERLVDLQVRRRIGRRLVVSLFYISVQVHHNHVVRLHLLVLHTGRLDDDQSGFPVHPAYIAPGKGHKTIPRQLHIGFIYLFF